MSNVTVCVRFRPVNRREVQEGGSTCVQGVHPETVMFNDEREGEFAFSFGRAFYDGSTQAEVFEFVALPIVKDAMNAVNGTILAYGQTGTGKTHSMEGPNLLAGDPHLKGMLPRVVETIFKLIADSEGPYEFFIKLSVVEIYMERIRDLFDTTKDNLQVKEDKAHGIYVAGATEKYVQTEQEMLQLLEVGIANRAVGATQMNPGSSRSHCVFLFTIEQRNTENQSLKRGKIFLVDLAGSEKLAKTGAGGKLLDEAKTINKSLSSLGNVINALTCGKTSHVPYRDSKLTRILQESLGGNSRTTLLCCCSPSSCNAAETLSTLRFGTRAKQIKNRPIVNTERGMYELEQLLERSGLECDQLRSQVLLLNARLRSLTEDTGAQQDHVQLKPGPSDLSSSTALMHSKSSFDMLDQVCSAVKEIIAHEKMVPKSGAHSDLDTGLLTTALAEIRTMLMTEKSIAHQPHSTPPSGQQDETSNAPAVIQATLEEVVNYCDLVIEENESLKVQVKAYERLLDDIDWKTRYQASHPGEISSQKLSLVRKPQIVRPLRAGTPAPTGPHLFPQCSELEKRQAEQRWSLSQLLEIFRRGLLQLTAYLKGKSEQSLST